jgi:hypothetical protein
MITRSVKLGKLTISHHRTGGLKSGYAPGGVMPSIRAGDVVRDVLAGMTDVDLMAKYQVSEQRFKRLLKRLVDERAISHVALYERSLSYRRMTDGFRIRRHPRSRVEIPLEIVDIESSSRGLVRDISEDGFRAAGLAAAVGEYRSFQLMIDAYLGFEPLLCIAQCIWSRRRGKRVQYEAAGFQIIDISKKDRNALRRFVNLLLLSQSGEWRALG